MQTRGVDHVPIPHLTSLSSSSCPYPYPCRAAAKVKPFADQHHSSLERLRLRSRLRSRSRSRSTSATAGMEDASSAISLMEFIGSHGADVDDDMAILVSHLQSACKRIAALVASPSNSTLSKSQLSVSANEGRDAPKPLDLVANNILKSCLKRSGKVAVMASEEDDQPIFLTKEGPYVVVFDPLDGSRNIDVSIPTGTIFGIYKCLEDLHQGSTNDASVLENVLQRGSALLGAGYALYSSATIFCTSFGQGTHGFTLEPSTGEFMLTHPRITIPSRGQIYSVNDARYFDWPDGLRNYIDNIRQGKGQTEKKYSARYICSLVADFHRTLLYGGIAMNPRDHLRLVYEANPLSFLVEHAGGSGSDGKNRILNMKPTKLHQRLPLFLGSREDITELESYDDVQQTINPGYDV